MKETRQEQLPLINDRIRAPRVQLITHEGENIGIVDRHQALRMAQEASLDLVLLSERGGEGVPVVKIMDFGKDSFEKKKKKNEAKKHQKEIQVKEVKIRPKIGEHDYQTKINQMIQFLQEGKRVKLTLCFRGRENVTKEERGKELFDRVDATIAEKQASGEIVREKDMKLGQFWSRVYYLKNK